MDIALSPGLSLAGCVTACWTLFIFFKKDKEQSESKWQEVTNLITENDEARQKEINDIKLKFKEELEEVKINTAVLATKLESLTSTIKHYEKTIISQQQFFLESVNEIKNLLKK